MTTKAIPDGYHSITPYLSLKGAADAIEFYKKAFGAEELFRLPMPNGDIGHAEIRIGDSSIMLADSCDETGFRDPTNLGGTSVGLYLYVEDVDAQFARAVEAGAKVIKPVEDQFYGDRNCTLEDPFGHTWFLSTHTEDVTPEELQRRMQAMFDSDGG